MKNRFDVVVIGGGHAGIEAAWAASQMGAEVALVTMEREALGRMSCNPAIGGLGKGQIVREIDALGGLMGVAIDEAGIQFRMLNRSKGPAVWAPRAQADRGIYTRAVGTLLSRARTLHILEGLVEAIETRGMGGAGSSHRRQVTGVSLRDGRRLRARAVVLATGTFLRGLMHCGPQKTVGGRVGEAAAVGLSACLRSLGLELGRLKTGTPPRVHRDTVDYSACEVQHGDEFPTPFSLLTDVIHRPQIDCWITWTNAQAHEPILANLHRAPMYSGQIESAGPRYCPSIEDKVVRFSDKPRHQIFLEPEGYESERIYCNGIATSLPQDVQEAFLRKVPGLTRAEIVQYGYAIEYDWVPTHQVRPSLEAKLVDGLFLAGQINGTSGYEEAAGQGFVAGVNAAQLLREAPPFVPGRDESYIGVMIDDLITRPPKEPYRMFTSRAEYRLLLRADNADRRLTPIGRNLGTVDTERWKRFERKSEATAAIERLCHCGGVNGVALSTWIRRPDANLEMFADALYRTNASQSRRVFGVDELQQVLINAKYSGYVDRQAREIERFRRLESMAIPQNLDYSSMPGLRLEARERLARVAPQTLGQASRISGINPADITVLWIFLTRKRRLAQREA